MPAVSLTWSPPFRSAGPDGAEPTHHARSGSVDDRQSGKGQAARPPHVAGGSGSGDRGAPGAEHVPRPDRDRRQLGDHVVDVGAVRDDASKIRHPFVRERDHAILALLERPEDPQLHRRSDDLEPRLGFRPGMGLGGRAPHGHGQLDGHAERPRRAASPLARVPHGGEQRGRGRVRGAARSPRRRRAGRPIRRSRDRPPRSTAGASRRRRRARLGVPADADRGPAQPVADRTQVPLDVVRPIVRLGRDRQLEPAAARRVERGGHLRERFGRSQGRPRRRPPIAGSGSPPPPG